MSTESSERIVATCDCGARLRVPASAAGKRGRCPKCGGNFVVPVPEPVPAEDAALGGEDDLLGALVAAERSGAAVAGGAPVGAASRGLKPCPSCATTLAADAVLCTSCGYNFKSGRQAKLKEPHGAKVAAVAGQAVQAAGGFVLGCVFCGVAALIGAGVWYGIAMATHYEFSFVAWVIGGLCGFAMALGSRETGLSQGIVAGAFALGSIVVAKLLIFNAVLAPVFTGEDTEFRRGFVMGALASEAALAEGHDPNYMSESELLPYVVDAGARVENMSDEDVQAELDRIADMTGEDLEDVGGRLRAEISFWKIMFGPIDVLFVVFAMITAMKVGSASFGMG